MKKLRVLQAILVLFSALAVTSCGDEPALPPLGPDGTNGSSLRVSMGNDEFEADEVTANVAGGAITITGTRVDEDAVGEPTDQIIITVNQTALSLSTPPDNITSYQDNVSITYVGSNGQEYVSVDPETGASMGAVTFTAVDVTNRTLTGNFTFIGYDPEDPTQQLAFFSGSFNNVVYTGDALPAPVPVVVPPVAEYMRAVIGTDTEPTEFGLLSATPTSGKLTLSGTVAEPLTSLKLIVDEAIAAGTQEFATTPVDGPYGIYNFNAVNYESTGGTLTIISNADGYIKGTFSFAAEDASGNVIEITEGEFNISTAD